MKNLKKFICFENDNIKKVLKNIRSNGARCSVIVSKKIKLIGTVSDGDIRKRLLRGSINPKCFFSKKQPKEDFY